MAKKASKVNQRHSSTQLNEWEIHLINMKETINLNKLCKVSTRLRKVCSSHKASYQTSIGEAVGHQLARESQRSVAWEPIGKLYQSRPLGGLTWKLRMSDSFKSIPFGWTANWVLRRPNNEIQLIWKQVTLIKVVSSKEESIHPWTLRLRCHQNSIAREILSLSPHIHLLVKNFHIFLNKMPWLFKTIMIAKYLSQSIKKCETSSELINSNWESGKI